MGCEPSTPTSGGELTLNGGVGFERITDHIEIGDGLVEDRGKVGYMATVSQSGIRLKSSISTLATYSANMSPPPST